MLRTILLILALVVLVVIGLFWMGVFGLTQTPDGGVKLQANTIEVTGPQIKTVPPANQAQPAP